MKLKSLLSIPFIIASASAATLIQDDFSGLGTDPLNGTSPDTNTLSSATWTASTIISADGQITDGDNTDRGATIDLGAGFSFEANETYTLTVGWSNLSSAILFAGFSTVAQNVNAAMQTQPDNFAVRIRALSPDAGIAAWTRIGATNSPILGSAADPTGSGSTTLTITTNNLTDATFSVDGVASTVVDLTGYRYLFLGYEEGAGGTQDARFTSVTFSGVPEPATTLLGSIGMLALLRRRR